jgi:hypothetical protein
MIMSKKDFLESRNLKDRKLVSRYLWTSTLGIPMIARVKDDCVFISTYSDERTTTNSK